MPKIVVTNDKGLIQQAGAGVNLSTGVAVGLQTVTPAGNASQAESTLIDISGGSIVSVTTTAAGQGVRMPDLAGSSLSLGQKFVIHNTDASSNTLSVYPFSGQKFIGAAAGGAALAANAAITIVAGASLECYAMSSSSSGSWLAFEPTRATNA